MKPDTGEFEPASGLTQQGRVRDDWGNWFGGDNSNLLRHFPLPDHYLRRNPHVAGPPPYVDVLRGGDPDPNKLFPVSHMLTRFNDFGSAGRVTSACSPLIYRDVLLGPEYHGNAFVCEPVHNLVTRRVLEPKSVTFLGKRAADEQASEFLASTDNWFRPVQVRTGPDGALWVVDMYRFVIEHPRWITPERLAELDVRTGTDSGRIYRIYPEKSPPRPIPRLDKLGREELVKQLESPNGMIRDLAMGLIVERQDKECVPLLEKLAKASKLPQGRMQALCALEGLGQLKSDLVRAGMRDARWEVRCQAIRLTESQPKEEQFFSVDEYQASRISTPVDLQLACSIGRRGAKESAAMLQSLFTMSYDDPFLVAAALSSLSATNVSEVIRNILTRTAPTPELAVRLIASAAGFETLDQMTRLTAHLLAVWKPVQQEWQIRVLAEILESFARKKESLRTELNLLESIWGETTPDERLRKWFAVAADVALSESKPESLRLAAIHLLGWMPKDRKNLVTLQELLAARHPPALQVAAVNRLAQMDDSALPGALVVDWTNRSPALRSRIIDLYLSREAWLPKLLDAVKQGVVSAGDFGPVRTQHLLSHRNGQIRKLAAEALHVRIDPDRQKLIASYRQAMKPGDAARGRAVYEKTCAACHKLGETGHAIGPDLAAVTDRSTQALLIAILDPNRAVDGRYFNFVASTKRGLQYSGMLQAETATSITLVGPEGKKQELLRTELEEFTNTGKSLMPDGLEKEISPSAMADLVAYLQTLGKPPKQVPGNAPKLVTASADGVLHLRAADCEIHGGDITFEAEFANLGMWHGEGDHAVWSLEVPNDGKYRVDMNYACDNSVAGNSLVLSIAESILTHKVAGTGRWSDYGNARLGEVELKSGRQRMTVRPAGPVRGALLDLREIKLTPVK
jgi:putative heme-binding domain-containing protein